MRILIILSGPPPHSERVQAHAARADYIIAADGGATACVDAHIIPDLVIGDMDSLEVNSIPGNWSIQQDKSQNTTDFGKALTAISTNSISQLIILGGLGGRVDHELTNLHIASRLNPRWSIEFESAAARVVRVIDKCSLTLPVGDTLSLIPWPRAFVRKTTGLQWNLTNTLLSPDEQLGQSNRVIQSPVTLSLEDGILYAIHVFTRT